jgi:nucleotide-binding universal stress UspA family protein
MVMNEHMRILMAYDGSSSADAALDDLRWAGLPREAEALLLTVVDVGLRLPSREESEASSAARLDIIGLNKARQQIAPAVEAARAMAVQAGERVRAHFPGWEVRAEAVADSPASAIIRLADEWPADLIVVGAQGRSALNRLMLGSVSQKVVTSAACSVRIARGRPGRTDASLRIVVCIDGSADAAAAVRAVAKRVWPDGTEACVFAVRNRYWSEDDMKKWFHEKVDAAVDELRTAGLTGSSVLREGHPQRALLEEITRWGADCVFVGSRGLGQVKRFLLGSVSAAVAVRAHCSVEVVRTAAEQ